MSRFRAVTLMAMLLSVAACRAADLPTPQKLTWTSAATGGPIDGLLYSPADAGPKPLAVVIYQKNLAVPRIGQEADAPIVADLLKDGSLVLVLDYAKNEKATSPTLNADSLQLRKDLTGKTPTLLAGHKIDGNHIFLLAEGFRLARNVTFATDGRRTLGMDIAYPSRPKTPVPLLLEYSCDNAERMGSGSLLFCHDTLLDGGMYAGFAVAMADHPVAPPYKGFDDPMPAVFDRAKDAVVAAHQFAQAHGLLDRVGVIGFSRGAPIAAMMAVSNGWTPTKDHFPGAFYDVQAALIHGNRYDYLSLIPADKMAARFKQKWGDPATQPDRWAVHSAVHYIGDAKKIAPMFLNTSRAESPEYQDGLAKFDKKLTDSGVPHVYQVDEDTRGHQVSTDPKTLAAIYDFFATYLKDMK